MHSAILTRLIVAKAELGTKRTDPETGKKFYDLNRDPIVSPYTGKSYPLSFFEETSAVAEVQDEDEVAEVDTENTEVELVSLEDADDNSGGDDIPDMGDDDVEIEGDDDDTFLEADEDDEDDDMSDIIGVTGDEDEV
nr:TIGR02300 family protein [Rhizobium sp. BK379]